MEIDLVGYKQNAFSCIPDKENITGSDVIHDVGRPERFHGFRIDTLLLCAVLASKDDLVYNMIY